MSATTVTTHDGGGFDAAGFDIALMAGSGTGPASDPATCGALEDMGYAGLWAGEVNNCDAFSQALLAGIGTRRALIGAIVPAFTRTPTVLAMTAGTIARACPGRLAVAVGASSRLLVENWSGVPYVRPYARVRDTLAAARAATHGEKVDHEYDSFHIKGFRAPAVADPPPSWFVAGVGERMIALAGDVCDGVLLNWCTATDAEALAAAAGPGAQVASMVYVAPFVDAAAARAAAVPLLTDYLSVPGYADLQRRLGRADVLADFWEVFRQQGRAAAREAFPAEVADALVISGSPAACHERVEEFRRRGIRPVVSILCPPEAFLAAAHALAAPATSW